MVLPVVLTGQGVTTASESSSDWLIGVGTMLTGLSTTILVVGAIAGWKSYQAANRRGKEESSRQQTQWLATFFDSFYRDERFTRIRTELEFHYFDSLDNYVQAAVSGRFCRLVCTGEELLLGAWLDNLLNVFEFLRFLEHKKQVPSEEVDAIFSYYLYAFIREPSYAAVQLYCRKFGFKKIISGFEQKATVEKVSLSSVDESYVFVYGTLRPDADMKLSLARSVEEVTASAIDSINWTVFEEDGWVSGRLLDLGAFPGLLLDRKFLGSWHAEAARKVYGKVLKLETSESNGSGAALDEILRMLDMYEEADITGGRVRGLYGDLLYERMYVPVYCPSKSCWLGAWAYEYVGDQSAARPVPSGRWDKSGGGVTV